jgi:phospholipase C
MAAARIQGPALALLVLLVLPVPARAQTATPIEHLIVVVGENLSFDNLFGTYRPQSNAKIRNLLSQGIVNRDGSPGPEFTKAAQRRAEVRDTYQVTPHIVGTYGELPRPGTTYAPGLPRFAPDARFPALLANGPFQITKHVDYTAAVGDPVHRFFQMWQQVDGGKMTSSSGWTRPRAKARRTARIRIPAQTRAPSRWASTTWPRATRPISASSPTVMRSATITTSR